MPPTQPPLSDDKPNEPESNRPRRVRSDTLMCGHKRLIIEHANVEYCLRITRNQRLILTKL